MDGNRFFVRYPSPRITTARSIISMWGTHHPADGDLTPWHDDTLPVLVQNPLFSAPQDSSFMNGARASVFEHLLMVIQMDHKITRTCEFHQRARRTIHPQLIYVAINGHHRISCWMTALASRKSLVLLSRNPFRIPTSRTFTWAMSHTPSQWM